MGVQARMTVLVLMLASLLVGLPTARGTPLNPSSSQSGNVVNMNGLYTISNPLADGGPGDWDSRYSKFENVSYFDVYSPPISSTYGEVYWTMMEPVPLPPEVVSQFSGKTMAIVGYETDQVFYSPGKGDVSVPITHAYNHHYMAYLSGTKSHLVELKREDPRAQGMTGAINHGAPAHYHTFRREDIDDTDGDPTMPTSQFFSEGNGGEFRKSYHGYPRGRAQLIESPTTFHIQPMQIDTKNRHYPGPDFRPDLLPAASLAPANASYSGLLECPCTDRIVKKISIDYALVSSGSSCPTPVTNASECFLAAASLEEGKVDYNLSLASSSNLPRDCSVVKYQNGSTIAYFNQGESSVKCGGGQVLSGSYSAVVANMGVSLHLDGRQDGGEGLATMTLTGPSQDWFAIALGSPHFTMADQPYTIVVDGKGNVEERKLGNHSPGTLLASSVRVTSNSVKDGVRSIILTRPFRGATGDHYSFSVETPNIPVLAASGSSPTFSYHGPKTRTGGTLSLAGVEAPSCLCNQGTKGSINGIPFKKNCLSEPNGDLVLQNNPTCWVDTYQGGQSCCHHGTILLDKDQTPPTDKLTYRLKFRFYHQPYTPAAKGASASHTNLVRMYYQTEAWSSEYDVPQCPKGTPPSQCIHMISAHFTVADMARNCSLRNDPSCWGVDYDKDNQGINLIYAGGHCHAPSCISMELYHADTGRLLCSHSPSYGKSHEVFDELDYITLPPCLWGDAEEGLMAPVFLPFNANLTSIKRNNATYGHYGEMASWQMRGILTKLPGNP